MASHDSSSSSSPAAASGAAAPDGGLSWRQLQQLDSLSLSTSTASAVTALSSSAPAAGASHLLHPRPAPQQDDDARSVGSRLSNAGSTYSAATFYSFSTSNYSGFAGAGELARRMAEARQKRHYVHPQDLDPNAIYDVDWVQDDAASACMACFAEFSALIRRKHHCRACGRVVCSTCLRHRLPVSGLRGLQKACDDCARVHAAKRKDSGEGAGVDGVVHRGACESISEDTESNPRHSPAVLPGGENKPQERKVEGEKQSEEPADLEGAGSAAQLHRRRRSSLLKANEKAAAAAAGDEEAFPTRNKARKAGSSLGYLAVAAAGTAVAVGSVLVMRNPQLVASVVAQIKSGMQRR